ncbi:LamG-like jellyroll fold domain-containing protein [Actinoplanes sp. NPDC026623]|uniref:LamG-like jellyroll fold domain-containing protein n=1 Tax=Actinoplanes sp. NPDC026623 TaxID=3155610 RepID=UPI0033EEC1B0
MPSLTDAYSTTSANPDGTLTAIYSSAPQRVRKDNAWVPIDTTLVRQKDGSYAPKAALSSLSISGGSGTDLLSMKDGAKTLKFSWGKKLPAAVVAGDTATYPNVLPDVDLQVTADATGYSSMLVVKTPEAAANPALKQVDFGLTGTGVKLAETSNGGAEAVDTKSGERVFHTDTALMWDSTPPAIAPQTEVDAGELGRNRAKIKVGVKGGKQTLVPDQGLLTSKNTKFPVYIDPYWSGSPGKSQLNWARISSNGWNVYNSTSKTGSTSARIGYDNYDTGDNEKARSYYQMNTAGIKGATIFEASLYVVHRWSALCTKNTAAVVYGTGGISSWSSSGLNWDKQPSKLTGVLSTVNGTELDCGSSKVRPSPASFKFNVLSFIKTAATNKASNATFLVAAKSETDKYNWKQLGYGGGATLSVKYSYKPVFTNGTGNPKITPSVVDQGRILTTTRTPTLSATGYSPKMNGYQENVQVNYQVFNSAGTRVGNGYGPSSGYALNGGTWTVTPSLADGTYTWKAAIKNASGVWGGVWSQTQTFTVDTSAPKAPSINSTHFPPGALGNAYSQNGLFQLANDRTNNVIGYLFSLDGDLANVTYAANRGTAWTSALANTAINPGTIYFAKADNAWGYGATTVINGTAGVQFSPGTAGAHRVFAKAVDQAGTTSPQTTYSFFAGTSTPFYAPGGDMIAGWSAWNTDNTYTTVPKATTTSTTGQLISQVNSSGWYFYSGYQAMLANKSTTSKVAVNDTATLYFNVPQRGRWDLGASLMTASDYGSYSLTLDKGLSTEQVLIENFDAYNPAGAVKFRSFGAVVDATNTPRIIEQGVHSITLKITGKNAASAGYQAGIDAVRMMWVPACPINSTGACLNNAAISTLTPGTTPTITAANADGPGSSFEAAQLKAAGWTPGSTVTVNGAKIKLADTFGDGRNDNILSSGQVVTVPGSGVVNKGNALVFVGFTTNGPSRGATGTINYAETSCGMKSQQFTLDTIPDWTSTPASEAVYTAPTYNKSTATTVATPISLFATSVPLYCPGAVVSSIILPVVTNVPQAGRQTLHFLGMGIRPTSVTGSGSTATHWVGSWAAAQDSAAIQATVNGVNSTVTLTDQTVRIPAHLSIGTGGGTQQVRVHLANALGKTPLTLDAASVGLQDPALGGASAKAAPIGLTFGGSKSVTLPAGTDVVSDPVNLSAPDRTMALVSIKVRGTVTALSGHRDAKTPIYVSAADNVDHTGESAATGFTTFAINGHPFLSGIDVTTSTTDPAGAMVLFGDQTVNSDTAGGDGISQLNSRLAEAFATAEQGNGKVPMGVLNLGSSSWSNQAQLPAANGTLPENATALVDRAILGQANVRSAVISAGSSDLLACTATTAEACADPVKKKLLALTAQLRRFKTDDASNAAVRLPSRTGGIKVYVATLPPFAGTHSAVQEAARKLINEYILGNDGTAALQGYSDGTINFAAAVSTDLTEDSDTVNSDFLFTSGTSKYPNNLYYAALARQVRDEIDEIDWIVDDQTGGTEPDDNPVAVWEFDDDDADTAYDTGWGTGAGRTRHNAALTDVASSAGRLVGGKAGGFNGASSFASTELRTNTTQSFAVAAWVRLTDKSADRTVFTRDSNGSFASLYFQYQKSTDRWLAQMPTGPSSTAVMQNALSSKPAQAGVWTHLAAVYDAELKTLTLYVNGVPDTSKDGLTTFNDVNGATWIGRSRGSTWFAGDIADVRVWNRAPNEAEMEDLAAPELLADWQFEDDSDTTIAKDWTSHEHHGTLAGGAAYTYPGHNDSGDIGAVRLNGSSAIVTSPALLRTDQSFTVAAWARITRSDANYTVLSQEGAHAGRFLLQYSYQCGGCWRFTLTNSDVAEPGTALAEGPAGAALNTWIHLAASYDAGTGAMVLYINGEPAATATFTATPWNADGTFTLGRARWDDHDTDWFPGDVDAVKVYQGVEPAERIKELSLS